MAGYLNQCLRKLGDASVRWRTDRRRCDGSITTTLYGIDSKLDVLVIQNPLNTVGSLGFNTSDQVGFDIFFFGNQGFASLTAAAGGPSSFFSINLATGAATQIGMIGNGFQIRDLAIQQVPEPGTITLLAGALLGLIAVGTRRRMKLAKPGNAD